MNVLNGVKLKVGHITYLYYVVDYYLFELFIYLYIMLGIMFKY